MGIKSNFAKKAVETSNRKAAKAARKDESSFRTRLLSEVPKALNAFGSWALKAQEAHLKALESSEAYAAICKSSNEYSIRSSERMEKALGAVTLEVIAYAEKILASEEVLESLKANACSALKIGITTNLINAETQTQSHRREQQVLEASHELEILRLSIQKRQLEKELELLNKEEEDQDQVSEDQPVDTVP
tara:strand:+ start:90 stop:662 length:573 start_codon:yes stop_codon:yes gene_type:complete